MYAMSNFVFQTINHSNNFKMKELTQKREIKLVSFGEALEALKQNHLVARNAWDDKSIFIWINKGNIAVNEDGIREIIGNTDAIPGELFEAGGIGTSTCLPSINMRTSSGATLVGWQGAQTDILADDWYIYDLNDEFLNDN